jgi:hypothetical protein
MACNMVKQDQESREIVQWLAANLKPEHVAYNDLHSQQHQLSIEEQAVANSFSASLKGPSEHEPDWEDCEVTEGRQRSATASVLADAASKLTAEATKARLID